MAEEEKKEERITRNEFVLDMDYEKLHKDTLKGLQRLVSAGRISELEAKSICQDFIAESEDERIRKRLIALVEAFGQGLYKNEMLAYLEKQKDASKAIEAVERIDKYIDEHVANAHDMKDSNPDKKYYRGWDDALAEMSRILQDVYSNEKHKEQKPDIELIQKSWYIEGYHDAKFKQEPKWVIKTGEEGPKYELNPRYGNPIMDEQNPEKWSEEDEAKKERLISIVKRALHGNEYPILNDNGATELITWLKSLRPHPHWKPSEEQMSMLLSILNERNNASSESARLMLESLYNDLKAL